MLFIENGFTIAGKIYDRINHFWESKTSLRISAGLLVSVFLFGLILIQGNIWGLLPKAIAHYVPLNHFAAIEWAFILLLFIEIVSLVLTLAHSVSASMLKQFEILSLIMLRQAFKEFGAFPEPMDWTLMQEPVLHVLSDAGGAIFLFFFVVFIARFQRHLPITKSAVEQVRFVKVKKAVALLLLGLLLCIGLGDFVLFIGNEPVYDFFKSFYTVLIFSDILIVLISMRYSSSYIIVFRNSAFALATVIIRLALTAPPLINAGLGLIAAFFVLLVVLIYNRLVPDHPKQKIEEAKF